jgi:hypothetical protein
MAACEFGSAEKIENSFMTTTQLPAGSRVASANPPFWSLPVGAVLEGRESARYAGLGVPVHIPGASKSKRIAGRKTPCVASQ